MQITESRSAHGLHYRSMLFKSLIGLSLTLISCAAIADSVTDISAFEPCRIGDPPVTVAAQCATVKVSFTHGLTTATNKATSDDQTKAVPDTLSLSVAKIPARTNQAAPDPVTLLAGGPGQSATRSWPQLQAAFHPVLANRDIYLIDQRGTGNSSRMDCPAAPPDTELNLDLEQIHEAAIQCYESQPLATQWFTTSVAVRDLDAVRQALGVNQWNLYGVSYGSRVALHYLRRYPDNTRSVIIDAVVAPQKPIGPELPIHSQDALDALFKRCSNDSGCANAFPELAAKTDSLFKSLKQRPRTVQYENLSLGTLDSMEFTDKHLAAIVRLLSYSSYGTAILPSMLYDASANGNFAPFARQAALQTTQLEGALAAGMHAAVICTEDAPHMASIENRDQLVETYLGDFIIDSTQAGCEHWPPGVIDSDFHEPVKSNVPVLALSGAVDPITPPAHADMAIEFLTNSRHIVNPHQAHTQALLGCVPKVMSQFIETTNPDTLHIKCLERLAPPALFVDANGPLP